MLSPYHNNPIINEIKELEIQKRSLRRKLAVDIEAVDEAIYKLRVKRQKELDAYDRWQSKQLFGDK